MEEILASIRRIIADDQTAKPPAPPTPPVAPAKVEAATPPKPVAAAPVPAPALNDDDVLDLKPKRAPEPHFIADDPVGNDLSFMDPVTPVSNGQDDIDALMADEPMEAPVAFEPPAPVAFAPPAPAVVQPMPAIEAPQAAAERLVSPETDRAVTGAFQSLAGTILSRNARTLEDLMQDMMRPMIKDWLDDHLPSIVERLVKAEIERVARGGR